MNASMAHSATLSICTKLPLVFQTFVLSIFEWPLKIGYTVGESIMREGEFTHLGRHLIPLDTDNP